MEFWQPQYRENFGEIYNSIEGAVEELQNNGYDTSTLKTKDQRVFYCRIQDIGIAYIHV